MPVRSCEARGAGLNVTTSESLRAPDSYHLVPPTLVTGIRWTLRQASALPWFAITFSTRAIGLNDTPVLNAEIRPEPWWLALAFGATLAFDGAR